MHKTRHLPCFLFGATAAALTLAACHPVLNPKFMPAGYTYHSNEYKSPEAHPPWDIGYEYTTEKNAEVLEIWEIAAMDLTDRLESQLALADAPIFLASPDPLDNAFSLSLDHSLRQELRERGYTLETIPTEGSIKLAVSAYDPEFKDKMRSYVYNDAPQKDLPAPPKEVSKDIVLKVDTERDGKPLTIVEDTYNLPLYGYQDRQLYFPLGQEVSEVFR